MNIIILLIWGALMCGALYLALQNVKLYKSKPRHRTIRKDFYRACRSAQVTRDDFEGAIHSPEWHKLLRLVHSVSTAERLVADYKNKNPSRSLKWCIEKAAWDVERDRRY